MPFRIRICRGLLYGLLPVLVCLTPLMTRSAPSEEGIALAIVYDTSGSMKESVKGTDGSPTAKYRVANRALVKVAAQIQVFLTNSAAGPRRIECGVFVFDQSSAREVVPFGPFRREPIEEFARKFDAPQGSTPLGNALLVAGHAVLKSPLKSKHVLVITDGVNTSGPDPSATLPRLKQEAAQKDASVSAHFLAFDVDARVFDKVKKQGATVASAMNESQLDTQIQIILQRHILLEDEEKK